MAAEFEIVTFDCYGTLIDWNAGIVAAFAAAAAADGVDADPETLRRRYAEAEREVESGPYRAYRDVLAESALRAAAAEGWEMSQERAREFAGSLPTWRPFADTVPALERLVAAGVRLGILSNVDDALLAGTLEHLPVHFDLIVTAEHVLSYKPADGHFLAARRLAGGARWLHAAQSYYHDVVPAARLGIASAWINRHGQAPAGDARPLRELGSLAELADWLAPARD